MTAIAFFFIICTSVAMGIAGFRLTVNFEKARLHEHFALLASYLASNAELGVMLGNKKMLTGLAENMLEIKDVQGVEITKKNGGILVGLARNDPAVASGSASALIFSSTMGQDDSPFLLPAREKELLGEVRISFSHGGLEELKQKLALRFLLVSLALAAVAIAMYWMLSRAIISPLHALLNVARQVSEGRLGTRAEGGALLEINTLATAFNDMLDTLELQRRKLSDAALAMARQEALAEVGKFSMIVAHEIKNPLAIIKGSLAVLQKEETTDARLKKKLMVFLNEEVERINKLVEDFLLFARPQKPDLRHEPLGLLLASLSQRLRLMQNDVELEIVFPAVSGAVNIHCDKRLLERALLNIVRNAMDVSPKTAAVKIRGYCSHRLLVLTIQDKGPGVAGVDRERIFEPFYSTKAKGTGLGLAIVREIVKIHGGRISVTNRKSGGACFTLGLPLAGVEQEEQRREIWPIS